MSAKTKTNTLHTLEAQVLARELLRHHEQVCRQLGVGKPKDVHDGMIGRSVMPYGTLCELAGVPFLTYCVGRYLGEIAEWCDKNGWPPLNALAVNNETRMPGDGYDGAVGCDLLEWPEQARKCIAFGRYPLSATI